MHLSGRCKLEIKDFYNMIYMLLQMLSGTGLRGSRDWALPRRANRWRPDPSKQAFCNVSTTDQLDCNYA